MATTFTQSDRLADLVPFDPALKNAWGTPNSENMVLVDQALDGIAIIPLTGTTATLSALAGAPDQSRPRMQSYTGALTAPCTVTVPNVQKWGFARNVTTGGQNVVLSAGTGTTFTLLPNSFWYTYWTDGAGNVAGLSIASGGQIISGDLTVSGNATIVQTLTAGATTLSSLTVSGTDTASAGMISTGFDSGGANFRAVTGNYGVMLRNDGSNVFLLQTATGDPHGFFNSFRPFIWSLTSGNVTLAANGAATNTGGPLTVDGNLTVAGGLTAGNTNLSTLSVNAGVNVTGLASFLGNANVAGFLNVSGQQVLSGSGCWVQPGGVQTTPASWTIGAAVNTGNAYVGAGFFANSDARIKEAIEDITPEKARDWIMRGRPVTFRWKDGGKASSGFIAQEEYQQGRGDALIPIPDNRQEFAESDGIVAPGFRLTRDYNHDVAYLTAALQHVLKELDELKAKVR